MLPLSQPGHSWEKGAAVSLFLRCDLRLVLSSLFPCLIPPSSSLPVAARIVWPQNTSTEALGAAPECISVSFLYSCLGTPVLTHFLSRKNMLMDGKCVEPECSIITAPSRVGYNSFVGCLGKLSQNSVLRESTGSLHAATGGTLPSLAPAEQRTKKQDSMLNWLRLTAVPQCVPTHAGRNMRLNYYNNVQVFPYCLSGSHGTTPYMQNSLAI